MINVKKRRNSDGWPVYRITFKRAGVRNYTGTFYSREDACKFIEMYEQKHLTDPENYSPEKLKEIRLRDFPKTKTMLEKEQRKK